MKNGLRCVWAAMHCGEVYSVLIAAALSYSGRGRPKAGVHIPEVTNGYMADIELVKEWFQYAKNDLIIAQHSFNRLFLIQINP
jgi:hypothetical protein